MLSEEEIIHAFRAPFEKQVTHVLGIGDDAAIIPKEGNDVYLISKDMLIERVHFRLDYYSPQALAHKAIHSNLSDIAAMGGQAKYILLGLGLPSSRDVAWLKAFQQHFCQLCLQEEVTLIGGDTTLSKQDVFISITVIGQAPLHEVKCRNSAQSTDKICVAGHLGEAFAGLQCLEDKLNGFETLKEKALYPNALIKEGRLLGQQPAVSAMIDVSDGLSIDLTHLCHASGLGARVALDNLVPTPALIEYSQLKKLAPYEVMLAGGEDYALLFTVEPSELKRIQALFLKHFHTPLCCIGEMTPNTDIVFEYEGKPFTPTLHPFVHF